MEPVTKSGPCVVCGQLTDTGCGFSGEPGYITGFLTFLGVSEERATAMMQRGPGASSEKEVAVVFLVCEDCARRVNENIAPGAPPFRVGSVSSSEERMPGYRQPGHRQPSEK
ncbi:MAG: hypothetical protein ACOX8V_06245 [Thermoleophilia bacterium]|jgi:hypothetical protein